MIKTGGGRFQTHEKNVYFIACNIANLLQTFDINNHVLIAINEMNQGDDFLQKIIENPQKKVFVDSGVFNLAMTYARKHKVSHNIGLSMAPDDIDGFQDLFDKYVALLKRYGEHLWGYIEIDQGGRDNKIKTRTKLEALGLRPIPVYHPFTDGWDYFDELATRYDRICFGNIVKANSSERKRFLATAWERKRAYPNLWIHFLGLTPNQWLNALPISSGDSSSWLSSLRWTRFNSYNDGQRVGDFGRGFRYERGADPQSPRGADAAVKLVGYQSRMEMLAWRRHLQSVQELGISLSPPYHSKERPLERKRI